MAELRIAVIGAGAMGANHVRVLEALPGARLVAVADRDGERLRAAIEGRAARGYRDYRELLAEETLDGVCLAVPTRAHYEVALACIERGAPLLVEKPLAAEVEEGERLRAAAEERGVPLMVGHVERFNPAVRELKRRLEAGVLGRVLQIRTRRVGPFHRRERDVGVVHDLATHDIDVLHHLLGCEVEHVWAETQEGVRTPHEDALLGLLRFEDGTACLLEANWLTPVKVRELAVLGERGMLVADELRQELTHYPVDGEGQAVGQGQPVAFPGPGEAPLRAELEAFLRVARGEEAPEAGAAEALAAMRVADALVASARQGQVVRLQPVGRTT